MKKFFVLMLVALMAVSVLAGCTPKEPVEEGPEQIYKTVYSSEVTTLNYLITSSTLEFGIAANLVDTLVEYDHLGVIQPCLAESWEISPDGLTYTFKIRQGVGWFDHEGNEVAEVVAQDWVDSLQYVFTPSNEAANANLAYKVIKNAEKYYAGEISDFSQVGVKAPSKYKLVITLEKAVPYFLSMLDYSVFMPANGDTLREQGSRFGTDNTRMLYNGAYILTTFEHQNRRVFNKNEGYWDTANVHIKELQYQYNAESATVAPQLYLDGEITGLAINTSLIDEWMRDPELKQQVRPNRPGNYSYWYGLNFMPTFDEEYEPDNWTVAVNNLNFRKSLFHGLNRYNAMLTAEPFFPENKLSNTITPAGFADVDGKDYITFGNLNKFATTEPFDEAKAKEYRDKAKAELDGKVTWPIKAPMPYNTSGTQWPQRVQVIEQQMEKLLGADYIDIVPTPYPPTGYLNAARRSGAYAFQEINWGPDYADPQTWTDPFLPEPDGYKYQWIEQTTEVDENGRNKYEVYQEMVDAAKAELVDMEKRFELFANAEAYIFENAWAMPYCRSGTGYTSSKLNPFESPYSPFGLSGERFKGMKIHEKPMGPDEYAVELEKWEKARSEAK